LLNQTVKRKTAQWTSPFGNDHPGAMAPIAGAPRKHPGRGRLDYAETEAKVLTDLLEANAGNGPKMDDGKQLFHTDHGNKANPGAAPSVDSLSGARLALRSQREFPACRSG
jgi:hypothetical protein